MNINKPDAPARWRTARRCLWRAAKALALTGVVAGAVSALYLLVIDPTGDTHARSNTSVGVVATFGTPLMPPASVTQPENDEPLAPPVVTTLAVTTTSSLLAATTTTQPATTTTLASLPQPTPTTTALPQTATPAANAFVVVHASPPRPQAPPMTRRPLDDSPYSVVSVLPFVVSAPPIVIHHQHPVFAAPGEHLTQAAALNERTSDAEARYYDDCQPIDVSPVCLELLRAMLNAIWAEHTHSAFLAAYAGCDERASWHLSMAVHATEGIDWVEEFTDVVAQLDSNTDWPTYDRFFPERPDNTTTNDTSAICVSDAQPSARCAPVDVQPGCFATTVAPGPTQHEPGVRAFR